MEMFNGTFIVDRKKVADVMLALDGLVYELKIVPVRNAVVKSGKVASTAAHDIESAVIHDVKRYPGQRIHVKDIREYVVKHGGSRNSGTYFAKKLIAAKVLRKSKENGVYVKA